MRRMAPLLLCLSLVGCTTNHSTITVTGKAATTASAERIRVHMRLASRSKRADLATARLRKSLSEANRRISKFSTDTSAFRKDRYELTQPYVGVSDFEASLDLQVVMTKPEQLQDFLEALSGDGLCMVSSQQSELSDENKFREENRRQALLAARAKAEMMANTLGSKLGAVQRIEEEASDGAFSFYCTGNNHASNYRGKDSSGLEGVSDSATVKVTFALE